MISHEKKLGNKIFYKEILHVYMYIIGTAGHIEVKRSLFF